MTRIIKISPYYDRQLLEKQYGRFYDKHQKEMKSFPWFLLFPTLDTSLITNHKNFDNIFLYNILKSMRRSWILGNRTQFLHNVNEFIKKVDPFNNKKSSSTHSSCRRRSKTKLFSNFSGGSVGEFRKFLHDENFSERQINQLWVNDQNEELKTIMTDKVVIERLCSVYPKNTFLPYLFSVATYSHWWYCSTRGDGYCLFNALKDFKEQQNYGNNRSGYLALKKDLETALSHNKDMEQTYNLQQFYQSIKQGSSMTMYYYYSLFPYPPFNVNCILIFLREKRFEVTIERFDPNKPTLIILLNSGHFTRIECDNPIIKTKFIIHCLNKEKKSKLQNLLHRVNRTKQIQSMINQLININYNDYFNTIKDTEGSRKNVLLMLKYVSKHNKKVC